jgi:hypothetical protein
MRALMRRFGFRERRDGGGALALYAEAQLAGWVAPPPDLGAQRRPARPEQIDAEALLARFYPSQEC